MLNISMMTSTTCEWETPETLYTRLDDEFHFTLDVCATKENTKCEHYYTMKEDGLSQNWEGTVWCNPPYGRGIANWCKKSFEYAKLGGTVVLLVPSRTDTQWWYRYCMQATEIRFVSGRLHFNASKNSAPFPSAICIFQGIGHPILGTMIVTH